MNLILFFLCVVTKVRGDKQHERTGGYLNYYIYW